jgi:serine/threonine protein kinase
VGKLILTGGFAMTAPLTTDEFLDLVLKSGVVDSDRLRAYLMEARDAYAFPTEPAKVATLLIRDGILTQFQAEQFLQGKWRRFTIGRYKVLERLGAGRQCAVYLCEHEPTHRRVAIKVLPASSVNDPSLLERFYREARALSALDHPNIVRAYDIDQDETIHFLVMEYIDGSSLQYITEKCGPMAVLRAAHYMRQAALGLQHAHQTAGIIHRDIKPDDILVDRSGCVKIIDMSLARFSGDVASNTTRYEETVFGTPDYMAPEQAVDSHCVDIRADIYSLGATFYFCLTAYTPFPGGSVAQKLHRLQSQRPEPLRGLRPKIPVGLAALIERMMANEPAQRPQSPQEVADALAPFTREPIGPPPEDEMPRLCLAASGGREPRTDSGDL